MARTGAPTRAEVTDAGASGRAEAVMLNKGPFMASCVQLLRDILSRMQTNENKKMHMLRHLRVADRMMHHPPGGRDHNEHAAAGL